MNILLFVFNTLFSSSLNTKMGVRPVSVFHYGLVLLVPSYGQFTYQAKKKHINIMYYMFYYVFSKKRRLYLRFNPR